MNEPDQLHITSELPQSHAELAREHDDALIRDKFQTSWGISIDQYGKANLMAVADLFYDAVYNPGTVLQDRNIPHSEEFPSRNTMLSAPLNTLNAKTVPGRADFTELVRDTISRGITESGVGRGGMRHGEVLYDEASQSIEALALHGPVAIWTEGDMYGQPAKVIFGKQQPAMPGSLDQLRKMAGPVIGDVRRNVAKAALVNALATPESGNRDVTGMKPQEIVMISASEDKFAPREVTRLADYFKNQEVNGVVVIEDRLSNIQKLLPLLETAGLHATAIWVRQGKYGQASDKEYDAKQITETDTIAHVKELILNGPEKTGTIFDFDGVLSNQAARTKQQVGALQKMFREQQYLL